MNFTHAGPSSRKSSIDASGCQAESDDRVSVSASTFRLFEQTRFQVIRVGLHFAGRNFLVRRALKTEFADSQTILGSHGRTKHTAGHGTGFVEFAVPVSDRARDRAHRSRSRRIVSALSLVQHAADRIARKLGRQSATASRARSRTRAARSARHFQIGESST